jgi:hypothetical protein
MSDALSDGRPVSTRPGGLFLAGWCMLAAFGAYFCMYGFRKPFTAAQYAGATWGNFHFKTVLVTAQVLGYTLAKFLGIKVIAELPARRRAGFLLALIAVAELALLLFALTPPPGNCLWLFLNGLSLGLVFGLVLGFLEGRLNTEALAAALCASFIVADGVAKSAGAWLLEKRVSEYWMPAGAGLLFAPPLVLFVWMLTKIPPPDSADVAARGRRTPMDAHQRGQFFRRYSVGLVLLVLVYTLITVLRSVRADFAPEIWRGLRGRAAAPDVFAWSEITVAALVMLLCGSAVLIRDNRRAFFAALALSAGGACLIAVALAGLHHRALTPFAFMVLHGLGLYLPYIAVHTTLFERLVALTRQGGNVGFLIYLADAAGYLVYVGVMLARNLVEPGRNFLPFFLTLSWLIAAACVGLMVPCWIYFSLVTGSRRGEAITEK